MVRKIIDEYAADETGQADYALEANGGKVVDTRCHEYTDEPRQNVVKFLGIPIVHMSKQPDIIIKVCCNEILFLYKNKLIELFVFIL